ncbi:hypothetical protein ACIBG4_02385 [Nonomuraea sp. NPDC050383]
MTHLDAVHYDADWNFAAIQEKLVAGPSWVVDGNYASALHIWLAHSWRP